MNLQKKRVLVVGLGRTGVALVRFLAREGAVVTVSDIKPPSSLKGQLRMLKDIEFRLECGHCLKTFLENDLIILSPGVSPHLAELRAARKSGIPILSELELASYFIKAPIIAVTGTNGKTTTITLIGKVLRENGLCVWVGGNIGRPLISAARLDNLDYIVAEVSSFQLEITEKFHPYIAILLNISEDHLDRHRDINQYLSCKTRIFSAQTKDDWAILDNDNPQIASASTQATRVFFSDREEIIPGAYLKDGYIYSCLNGLNWGLDTQPLHLLGKHNYKNIMATLLVAQIVGCQFNATKKVIYEFKGLPHRLEWIGSIGNINFYNDSKGTNVGATISALDSLKPPIVLIAGGVSKGQGFLPLREAVKKRVRAAVLFGEAKGEIKRALDGAVPTLEVSNLKEATVAAIDLAKNKGNILFSPACASFDMFKDYRERGLAFKRIVKEIKKQNEKI